MVLDRLETFEVVEAPVAGKTLPNDETLRAPPFGMCFRAAEAAGTPKIDENKFDLYDFIIHILEKIYDFQGYLV